MTTHGLYIWTVYDHPSDFPDCFIARLSVVGADGIVTTMETVTGATLDELRSRLPRGLHRLNRESADDAAIVEVWL
jgi:hypothetical protein